MQDQLRAEIEKLQHEIASLQALTDAEIQAMVDDGQDPAEILNSEAKKAEHLRAVSFKLNTVEKRLNDTLTACAAQELTKVLAKQKKAQQTAQKALNDAVSVLANLAGCFEQFESARADYVAAWNDARVLAQQAGTKIDDTTDLWPMVRSLDDLVDASLQPYRRPKIFTALAIEPQEQN